MLMTANFHRLEQQQQHDVLCVDVLKYPCNMLTCHLIRCGSYAIKFSNHATLRNTIKFCYQFARILCLGQVSHAVFLLFASSGCVSEAMHIQY